MLKKVNAALFEAPAGARIQVVVEAQDNNGVNDARFQYAGRVLPRESILGLPGGSFTVGGVSRRFQAGVVFDPGAPGKARYDLLEVENGVKINLQKSVKNSDSSPLIGFAIDPVPTAVAASRGAGAAPVGRSASPPAAAAAARRKAAGKKKKKAAKKQSPRKKSASRKRTAKKVTARRQAAKRKASPRRRR